MSEVSPTRYLSALARSCSPPWLKSLSSFSIGHLRLWFGFSNWGFWQLSKLPTIGNGFRAVSAGLLSLLSFAGLPRAPRAETDGLSVGADHLEGNTPVTKGSGDSSGSSTEDRRCVRLVCSIGGPLHNVAAIVTMTTATTSAAPTSSSATGGTPPTFLERCTPLGLMLEDPTPILPE